MALCINPDFKYSHTKHFAVTLETWLPSTLSKGEFFTNQPHPEPHLGKEGLVNRISISATALVQRLLAELIFESCCETEIRLHRVPVLRLLSAAAALASKHSRAKNGSLVSW